MPRPARPRWNKQRRRWVANLGDLGADGRRKEVPAPADIGPREEGRAWVWFQAERRRRGLEPEPKPEPAPKRTGYQPPFPLKPGEESLILWD